MKELLLIQSLDLQGLIEDYRNFFLALMPSVFILAVIIEFFAGLDPFALVKRAFLSILLLTSVSSFYEQSIDYSIELADKVLKRQMKANKLLSDMMEGEGRFKNPRNFEKNPIFSFLKIQLFKDFANTIFALSIYFIVVVCLLLLKVVYSLVYYIGYGLLGIPCLLYFFPGMEKALRGGILSYVWCLALPHVLVFVLAIISSEISKGYILGQIIGGSIMGTALLFVLAITVAFVPLMTTSLLSKSGITQAGGILSVVGAHKILSFPKTLLQTALKFTLGLLFPKLALGKLAWDMGRKGAKFLSHGSNSHWGRKNSGGGGGKGKKKLTASPVQSLGQTQNKTQKGGTKNNFQKTNSVGGSGHSATSRTSSHRGTSPVTQTRPNTQTGTRPTQSTPQQGRHRGTLQEYRQRNQRTQNSTSRHRPRGSPRSTGHSRNRGMASQENRK